jgi:hypothetical protein
MDSKELEAELAKAQDGEGTTHILGLFRNWTLTT